MKYDGSVIIGTEVDTSGIEDGMKKLEKSIEKASAEAVSFSDVLRGNVLSQAIVGGVQMLGNSIKDMAGSFVESAAEIKAEGSQFEQTFGDMQGAASKAIQGVADNAGILETRLNTLGSQIYAFARASGGSTEESMSLMEKSLQAAADSAAYYDRSLEDTTETLQSFLKGNYENDAALGLSATEATRNAKAMEMFGLEFKELSEIQKQQALLQMVLDAQALSGAMGQAAREADGWENVQGNLTEAWRQFSANVGTPILANLVPIIQNITASLIEWTDGIDWTAFNDAVNRFVSLIMENGSTIIATISGIGAGFLAWNVVAMIQGLIGAVNAFKAANEGLKLSQIALNAVMKANPLAIVASLVAALVTAIIVLWNTNEDFRKAVLDIWESIKKAFVGAWEGIKAAWDVAGAYFTAVWGAISAVFSSVKEYLKGIFSDAWESVKVIVSGWQSYFEDIWSKIKSVFSNAWNVFTNVGRNIVEGIKNGISNAWNSFKGWVSGKFNGLVSGITGSFGRDASAAMSSYNLNRNIPHLATGSVVPPNREFMAVLGDNKTETEVVSPLSTMKQAFMEAMQESGGFGGGNYKFEIYINGRKMAVEMVKEVNRMTQEAGKPVLLF